MDGRQQLEAKSTPWPVAGHAFAGLQLPRRRHAHPILTALTHKPISQGGAGRRRSRLSQNSNCSFDLEDLMNDRMFDSPVFVKSGNSLIQEIACLEDALEFLYE